MSLFRVNVVARSPKDESRETPPIEALVDTGSGLTWLPADLLGQSWIAPRRKHTFMTATRQMVTRDIDYAILSCDGFETSGEVVFAEPGVSRGARCSWRRRFACSYSPDSRSIPDLGLRKPAVGSGRRRPGNDRVLRFEEPRAIEWYERMLNNFPASVPAIYAVPSLLHFKLGVDTAQRRFDCDIP